MAGRYALLRQTRGVVARYANNNAFFKRQFVRAMIKMGAVDVLTGRSGEIRRNCRRFNWWPWWITTKCGNNYILYFQVLFMFLNHFCVCLLDFCCLNIFSWIGYIVSILEKYNYMLVWILKMYLILIRLFCGI